MTERLPDEVEARLQEVWYQKGDMTAMRAAYRLAQQDTMKVLASGMKKVLTPAQLDELKWTCDPLGEFLKVLR